METLRVINLIESHAQKNPDKLAIIAENGQLLTYKQLISTVDEVSDFLNSRGVTANQRIAFVSTSGLETAIAYLAVSNVAAFVPLSPDYSEEQYRYYFKILKTDHLIVPEGYDGACLKIAEELKMGVFYLQKKFNQKEVTYGVYGNLEAKNPYLLSPAKDEDIAIVLFTSGTTSYPKIVPRSHRNIYWDIKKRTRDMNLTSHDRLLLTFPLFRGINLNDTLAVMASGGTAIYTEGLEHQKFFNLIKDMAPTWILGSPILFNSLTEYIEKNLVNNKYDSLRHIRASGAPLSEALSARMEEVFKVPVYIDYGMTETGSIANSQNSPRGIKKGAVGIPQNIDVGIMDENGLLQSRNKTGEIVVSGAQVIKAYDNITGVNETAFYGKWFRTGDAGYIDEDGYLFITGRFNEIINRGGEKVSPYEIEAAISRHPDILQVIVFPIPARDNEDVGAGVVLREGSKLSLKDMRRFLSGKVVPIKMPTALYVLEEIPVSEAQKVQRKQFYKKIVSLNMASQSDASEDDELLLPRNETEAILYEIYKKILPIKEISVTDTFFELGGDSLRAAVLYEQIQKRFKVQIPIKYIFNNSSIEALAKFILNIAEGKTLYSFAVPFQEEGSKTPIFFVHAAEGEAVIYHHIARDFDSDRPFYGINFNLEAKKWVHPLTFEQIADYYIKDIREIQAEGPYILAGLCVGGMIAYEMACQLRLINQDVSLLIMFDSVIPGTEETSALNIKLQRNMAEIKKNGIMQYLSVKYFYYKIGFLNALYRKSPDLLKPFVFRFMNKNSWINYGRSVYKIRPYDGPIIFFKPDNSPGKKTDNSINIWSKYVNSIQVIPIKGEHDSVFFIENAENTREALENILYNIP